MGKVNNRNGESTRQDLRSHRVYLNPKARTAAPIGCLRTYQMYHIARWRSAPEQHTETLDFRYGLLTSEKTGIRLAQILPGIGNQGISINLIDSFVTGTNQLPYDALSYTWGDGARTKNIICNGKRLSVTHTLLEALHRFRNPDNLVTLWIDQLCICKAPQGA